MKPNKQFSEVLNLIKGAEAKAFRAVNTVLIELYWHIGQYISERKEWGKSTVAELAEFLQLETPGRNGFSERNLWRMKQFYETYYESSKLTPLVTEINWTHHLIILVQCKTEEEREFYMRLCIQERLSKRELERQINSSTFERTAIANQKLAPVVRDLQAGINAFKDSYIFEFLSLPEAHLEKDLKQALLANLKAFILELGRDFTYMGEEYRLQVGNTDFAADLLFYHRRLQCIVAFELKTEMFQPSDLGQLNFYLEALDRDVKLPHEAPSIGILLCRGKDDVVVEYALSRTLSPALVADYQLKLPSRELLREKYEELILMAENNLDT